MNRGLAAATAIVVSFALGTALASREAVAAQRQPTHSCSAVDRDFIETATAQMTLFRTWSADYVTGADDGAAQAAMAEEAAQLVIRKRPQDVSLDRARMLMGAMLVEYQRAVTATMPADAGASLQRVHDLGSALRGLLADAAPGLNAAGCTVDALF